MSLIVPVQWDAVASEFKDRLVNWRRVRRSPVHQEKVTVRRFNQPAVPEDLEENPSDFTSVSRLHPHYVDASHQIVEALYFSAWLSSNYSFPLIYPPTVVQSVPGPNGFSPAAPCLWLQVYCAVDVDGCWFYRCTERVEKMRTHKLYESLYCKTNIIPDQMELITLHNRCNVHISCCDTAGSALVRIRTSSCGSEHLVLLPRSVLMSLNICCVVAPCSVVLPRPVCISFCCHETSHREYRLHLQPRHSTQLDAKSLLPHRSC